MASRWVSSGRGKRAVDLLIAVPAFVMLLPVALSVVALVRLRLGAPALFVQERAGRNARPIRVPKFRSMTEARDESGHLLPDDARLTPFGSRLRASSLDELPQLWLVMTGAMSLVGPRPLPTKYVERYSAEQRRRLEAVPGITGWAQVNGRNATSWQERFEMDVWYVDHATLLLDLKILLKTVAVAVGGGGVSSGDYVTMHEFMG